MIRHACFVVEVNNDYSIQKRHWYRLYGILDKIVVGDVRDRLHCRRRTEEGYVGSIIEK